MLLLILANLIKFDIRKRKLKWMSSFFSNVASLKAQNYLILKNLNFLLERNVNCFQSEHIFKSDLKPKKALNV